MTNRLAVEIYLSAMQKAIDSWMETDVELVQV